MKVKVEGADWVLTETDPASASYGKPFGFSFAGMPEGIALALTEYCRVNAATAAISAHSIATQMRCMRYFCAYAADCGVGTLSDLTPDLVEGYAAYLKLGARTFRGGRPLSYRTQYSAFKDLRTVVRWLQMYRPPLAPAAEVFAGCEFPGVNQRRDIEVIPDSVMAELNRALADSGNVALVAAVRIAQATGMRTSDLLALEVGCMREHPVNGMTIAWYDHKAGRSHKPVPLPPVCAAAVSRAVMELQPLRDEMQGDGAKRLLVFRDPRPGHGCKPLTPFVLKQWVDVLVEGNGIAMPDGSPVNITVHALRRTLATDIVSKGTDITVAQELLGHVFATTTRAYYAKVKDPDAKAAFSEVGIVGDWREAPDACFDGDGEREWFLANATGPACLADGYCTLPVEDGKVCRRLMGRNRCFGCRRYITTPEYLDAHRSHLGCLRRDLADNAGLGEHYRTHLMPTIALLEDIIDRLEAMSDGC